MQTFDIAIIGGGIAGISLAYFLAPHRSVAVLEQESALGYHSTGRSAAEFTLRDNPPLVNALARASHAFMTTPPEGFASVPLLIARGSILFGTQASTRPPTFVLFTTGFLDPGYRRFIQRRLREIFGFEGTPIVTNMRVRERRQR